MTDNFFKTPELNVIFNWVVDPTKDSIENIEYIDKKRLQVYLLEPTVDAKTAIWTVSMLEKFNESTNLLYENINLETRKTNDTIDVRYVYFRIFDTITTTLPPPTLSDADKMFIIGLLTNGSNGVPGVINPADEAKVTKMLQDALIPTNGLFKPIDGTSELTMTDNFFTNPELHDLFDWNVDPTKTPIEDIDNLTRKRLQVYLSQPAIDAETANWTIANLEKYNQPINDLYTDLDDNTRKTNSSVYIPYIYR